MNRKQLENLAKFMYDLSKIVFSFAVVGDMIANKGHFSIALLCGAVATLIFLALGVYLDSVKLEENTI